MTYSVRVEGLDKFDFEKADVITRKRVVEAMDKSVLSVVAAVRPLTPVFQGRLRNSIASQVETSTSTVVGKVGSNLKGEEYPATMEFGRKPGSPPPVSELERWAHLVLGDASLAYIVARAIGQRGIKGRFYLKRGLENSHGKINDFFNAAMKDIGNDLVGK